MSVSKLTPRKAVVSALILSVVMAVLVAIGEYHAYTPTPIWDMWNGEVEFFLKARSGDLSVWFGQHNEHRITLARLFFWADLDWFGGRSIFLLIVNFALVAAAAALLWRIVRDTAAQAAGVEVTRNERLAFSLLITAWLFQWTQSENFVWAFQSQFFLVQLLPLCGFYWLNKAVAEPKADVSFFLACAFGFASLGAMANGVLALPLMTLYAVIMRQPIMRTATLGALALIGLALFMHNYYRPDGAPPPWVVFRQQPVQVVHFALVYLGNPFFQMARGGPVGHVAAVLTSLVLAGRATLMARDALRNRSANVLALALLGYLAFIGSSALLTATGRIALGMAQALASRYATPAVMAWAVFMALNVGPIILFSRRRPLATLAGVGVVAALLLAIQVEALRWHRDQRMNHDLASLALELGAADRDVIGGVFPGDYVFGVAEAAHKAKVSVFGVYPFRNDREGLGQPVTLPAGPACQGAMTAVKPILGEDHFVAVRGWVDAPGGIPQRVRFVDSAGRVSGYAITGDKGPRLGGRPTGRSAYRGYMLSDAMDAPATMVGDHPDCTLAFKAPGFLRLFSTRSADPAADPAVVGADRIQPGNQWTGADFYHSNIPGMKVFGSYISGDKDTGVLRVTVKPGERVYFRSGPTGGHQTLTLLGPRPQTIVLPVSEKWVELTFLSKTLPESGATLEFADGGAGWGEWSAVALRN